MKKIIALCLPVAAALVAVTASAQTFDFSNIQYWVGSGTNQSAMVIAWNDSKTPDPLVWGYKWNTPVSGTAPTVLNMIQAIQAADSRFLFTPHPWYPASVYSVFFDLTGSGGTPVVGKPRNMGGTENGYPPYPGDHYKEGWFSGFWVEVVGIGAPYDGGTWTSGTLAKGVGTTSLSNNSWYGLNFSKSTTYPYPVPNPAVLPTAVSVPPLTYVQWRLQNGITGGATDTPLKDGVANLLKYAFDINPSRAMSSSDRLALPVAGMTTLSGTQYLTLTYRQNQFIAGATVGVQISDQMMSWSTVTPDFTQQTGVDANTGDPMIQVGVHVTNPSRNFLRLNVVTQ